MFTNGCFDLLHTGHTRLLEEARKLGDVLIVAVNSDRSVRALKGSGRPLQPELERAELLAALGAVDYIIFDDDSVLGVVSRMLPSVLVKGGDYTREGVVGHAEVKLPAGAWSAFPWCTATPPPPSSKRPKERAWRLVSRQDRQVQGVRICSGVE